MNAADRAAILDGYALHDELRSTVHDRTLEGVGRRHRTAIVKERGWLRSSAGDHQALRR